MDTMQSPWDSSSDSPSLSSISSLYLFPWLTVGPLSDQPQQHHTQQGPTEVLPRLLLLFWFRRTSGMEWPEHRKAGWKEVQKVSKPIWARWQTPSDSYFHLSPDRSEAMQRVVFIPLATDDKISTINMVYLLRVCKYPLLILSYAHPKTWHTLLTVPFRKERPGCMIYAKNTFDVHFILV